MNIHIFWQYKINSHWIWHILGNIADKWFCLLRMTLPFCGLSVCALCSNGKTYPCTQFLLHTTAPYLPDCQTLAYIGQPFLLKFCPKVTHLLLIWAPRDIRWQIVAGWLEIAQMVTRDSRYKTTIALSNGTISGATFSKLPKFFPKIFASSVT